MPQELKRLSSRISVPNLSHPNYRELDWGPKISEKKRLIRHCTFSRLYDNEALPRTLVRANTSLMSEELRNIERRYRNQDAIKIRYCGNSIRNNNPDVGFLERKLWALTGHPHVSINDADYLKLIRLHLEGETEHTSPDNTLNYTEKRTLDMERDKPSPYLPYPFKYTGTIASRTGEPSFTSSYRPTLKLFRISNFKRNTSKRSALSISKSKKNREENEIYLNAIRTLFLNVTETSQPTESLLKQLLPSEPDQIALMYELAKLTLSCAGIDKYLYGIRVHGVVSNAHVKTYNPQRTKKT